MTKFSTIVPSDYLLLRIEAEKLAKDCQMKLYRTSVKEDLNVGVVFQHLAENYVKKMRSTDSIDSGFHSLSIGEDIQKFATPYRRTRSVSRDRYKDRRLSQHSETPLITNYLANPMFDRLHAKQRDKTIFIRTPKVVEQRACWKL